jgi:hypothetical protein
MEAFSQSESFNFCRVSFRRNKNATKDEKAPAKTAAVATKEEVSSISPDF